MARRKRDENEAKVADAILADPTASNLTLAKRTGQSKTNIQHYRNSPAVLNRVKARLAQGGAAEAARGSVANLLGALADVTDRLMHADEWDDESTAKALQLLAGLTGTLERMQRAGIDLTALASPDDTRALHGELARAYLRGVVASARYGPRAAHWAAWLVARHDAAGPMAGEDETKA